MSAVLDKRHVLISVLRRRLVRNEVSKTNCSIVRVAYAGVFADPKIGKLVSRCYSDVLIRYRIQVFWTLSEVRAPGPDELVISGLGPGCVKWPYPSEVLLPLPGAYALTTHFPT